VVARPDLLPARSLGPALAAGEWHQSWIYVIGPVVGAALDALAYQLVRGAHADPL
jgi:glycerol uptake facilitator-like aquaporin